MSQDEEYDFSKMHISELRDLITHHIQSALSNQRYAIEITEEFERLIGKYKIKIEEELKDCRLSKGSALSSFNQMDLIVEQYYFGLMRLFKISFPNPPEDLKLSLTPIELSKDAITGVSQFASANPATIFGLGLIYLFGDLGKIIVEYRGLEIADVEPNDYVDIDAGIFKVLKEGTVMYKKKAKSKKAKFDNFRDLWFDQDLYWPSLAILTKLDPPLATTNGECKEQNIGGFCVWIEQLRDQGIIKSYTYKGYAELLSKEFHPNSIDATLFGKPLIKIRRIYRDDIRLLVSKLSVLSDKERPERC